MKTFALLALAIFVFIKSTAQLMVPPGKFTHADTLRGTLNANRSWWNVLRYEVDVVPNYSERFISGSNKISFESKGGGIMQIDLQQPLIIDSIFYNKKKLEFTRDNNVCLIDLTALKTGRHFISIYYHGKPVIAKRPPWDGGWIFEKDKLGRPWMSVACQGLGASVWYPCKDHQSDEPDEGASLTITVPDTLTAVANGRLTNKTSSNNLTTYRWEVKNPINNYNLVPYIGMYQNFNEVYNGEDGKLSCDYWVLDYNVDKAKVQFAQVPLMLKCFESWFGPYPFYEDGYKLVESPHLGMEHQSAVAYGNGFANGYRGRDLSGTGWGSKWDYIIIHESGHEWFGNNVTTNDIADMWVHEGFTNYSEVLYTECQFGKKAGEDYCKGLRNRIRNDQNIIGYYGVNKEGSGDMYPKGANLIHTIRTIINDDVKFKEILRGIQKHWYHKTVTSKAVEEFISEKSRIDFSMLFDQYLRTTQVPIVEWKISNNKIDCRLTNCVKGLTFKLWIPVGEGVGEWQSVSDNKWTSLKTTLNEANTENLWNKNYYVEYRAVAPN